MSSESDDSVTASAGEVQTYSSADLARIIVHKWANENVYVGPHHLTALPFDSVKVEKFTDDCPSWEALVSINGEYQLRFVVSHHGYSEMTTIRPYNFKRIEETYDENTIRKVFCALVDSGCGNKQATEAISEMQNVGILFRERT